MKFRIRKQPRGYIVEYLDIKICLFGLKKEWKPFVKSSGLDCAWHHSSYDLALMNLLNEVERQVKNY
jgi:hypothetical protein